MQLILHHNGINKYPVAVLFLLIVSFCFQSTGLYAQTHSESAKFTAFAEHSDGERNENFPPVATYTAFLNGDKSRILIENSPLWDSNQANIPGANGPFTVQFGNFPELSVDDTMYVRFTDSEHREQGVTHAVVDTLPWEDPNPLRRLRLQDVNLPPKPADVQSTYNSDGTFTVSWDTAGDYSYLVYRRDRKDTIAGGQRRNLYVRVADSLKDNTYTDVPPRSEDSFNYIVYARNDAGRYSGHSRPMNRTRRLLNTVPQPIIPSRPALINMYEKAWQLALQNSKKAQDGSGFVDWYLDEAFDNRLFQWDVAFMMTFAKYSQGALPNIETLDNFYRKQHPDGAICGVLREWNGEDDEPKSSPYFTRNNLFSWAEWEYYKTTGDTSRFDRVIPVLADYARWIREHRRHPNGHFWWSGFGSGMDNSPRSTATRSYPPHSWIDYDANEAMAARYLVKMAEVAGRDQIVKEFSQFRDTMKTLVNRDMWSEEDQFYWDLDRDGSFMKIQHGSSGPTRKVMTVASFWPLWADITNEEQVEGLVGHLNNTNEFNRTHRVPTLAADDPAYSGSGDYWRGSVWAPTNHMIVEGLMTQDRIGLAREIVKNHLNKMAIVYNETGTLWENYAPETAQPGSQAKPDFVGWSGVGPIAQLIENYIGIIPSVPDTTVRWNLLTDREVGVANLEMGHFTIHEIRAKSRNNVDDPAEIIIDTERPFALELYDGNETRILQIKEGRNEYTYTGIKNADEIPGQLKLGSNYPNPFNPSTTITYEVPQATRVQLVVYNAIGRKVATLVDKEVSRGAHKVNFNAGQYSSGLYIYRLKTDHQTISKKMMLIK